MRLRSALREWIAGLPGPSALWLAAGMVVAGCASPRDNSGYRALTPTISAQQQAAAIATAEAIQMVFDQATVIIPEVDGNGPGIPYVPGPLTATGSGLRYYDQAAGDGPTPQPGDTAIADYTVWLVNGTKIDSSVERGTPLLVEMGVG